MRLERWQAEQLGRVIGRKLRYLGRLRSRMEQVGFVQSDHLFQLVTRVYDATHALSVELHYSSCSTGVGRSPEV